jgi:hypothetical protein
MRGIVAVAAQTGRGVDGKAHVVAELGAGEALRQILVEQRDPLAGEIGLPEGGHAEERGQDHQRHHPWSIEHHHSKSPLRKRNRFTPN